MSQESEQGNFVCVHLLAYRLMGSAHWGILPVEVLSIFGKQFFGKVDVLIRYDLMASIQLQDIPTFLRPEVLHGIGLTALCYFDVTFFS